MPFLVSLIKPNSKIIEGSILLLCFLLTILGYIFKDITVPTYLSLGLFGSLSIVTFATLIIYFFGIGSSILTYYYESLGLKSQNSTTTILVCLLGIALLVPLQTFKKDIPDLFYYWSFVTNVLACILLYCVSRSLFEINFSRNISIATGIVVSVLASVSTYIRELNHSAHVNLDEIVNRSDFNFYTYFLLIVCFFIWTSILVSKQKGEKNAYTPEDNLTTDTEQKENIIILSFCTIAALIDTFSLNFNLSLYDEPSYTSFYILGILYSGLSIYKAYDTHKVAKLVFSDSSLSKELKDSKLSSVNNLNFGSSVGMRSANFFIDHDPDDVISSYFLNSISQIRSLEIHRNLSEILGSKLFNERTIKNQIFGSINPKLSNRPCIDVLTMFASMYLIAIPAVNQRIRNLVRLLPIIDPELTGVLTTSEVDKVNSEVEWLFHFDYNWMDQQLFVSNHQRKFSFDIDNMKLSTRYKILTYLHKKIPMGNFIWIGESAKTRIIMEAPYLANIIETWPISLEDNESEVIFLIKFYDLIPRLKKYYNLDSKLDVIKSFEPSYESQKFIEKAQLFLQSATASHEVAVVIEKVKEFPFSGFSEKDNALELILEILDICENKKNQPNISDSKRAEWDNLIHQKLKPTLSKIGYPNQVSHNAQKSKRMIRSPHILKDLCIKPSNEKFSEAWLFLATVNASIYDDAQRMELINIVNSALQNKKILKDKQNMKKVIEAFFNISSNLDKAAIPVIQNSLNIILGYLAEKKAHPELIAFFLDAKLYLDGKLKTTLYFNPEKILFLKQHIIRLSEEIGVNSPEILGLRSRWDLLMSQIDINQKSAS